jgi:hypothetical protein
MKKKVAVTLGLLGVMAASMLGSSAFAHDRHDRHDRHDGWRNNRSGWNRPNYNYRPARSAWFNNNNHRVAYRPGNRWGQRYNPPRRGWW